MLARLLPILAVALSPLLGGCPGTVERLDKLEPDAEAPPVQLPVPLRLADYNAHDFFDDHLDAAEPVVTTVEYAAKVAAVGAVLASLGGDVVVLQEVENLRVLDALADGPLATLGYGTRVLVPGNDASGIQIGVLSRRPFDRVVSHAADRFDRPSGAGTTSYTRDCLELHLRVNGRHLALLGVHFKAKSPPDDADRRLAEGLHTRAIADSIAASDPSVAIAILGDFNDLPGSPPLLAVAGAAPDLYVDVATQVADAWSYDYQGAHQLIDHQMVSPRLFGWLEAGSVTLLHGAEADLASDHAPVAATYDVP